jgi:hypothetical protein
MQYNTMQSNRLGIFLLFLGCLIVCDSATAAEKEDSKKLSFIRIENDSKDRPNAIQLAVVRFGPESGKASPVVDLVSAVHIGEAEYYKKLNRRFTDYDSVLFELVTDSPEERLSANGKTDRSNPVSAIQGGMQDLLELEFQLDRIDYSPKNFVHADMSPDEFARSMEEKKDSMLAVFLRMIGSGLSQGGSSGDTQLFTALFAPDRAYALRRAFAKQFVNLRKLSRAIDGPRGSTLLSHRNAKALEVLREEIDDGKTKLAIFYGAAHMPDMARRLKSQFGLKPQSVEWITAWRLQKK